MWSKIQHTELATAAFVLMNDNEIDGCEYHNNDHIDAMYQYLEDTNEPYDEALDWAVMFHDVVYDNQPDKERRSLDLFLKLATTHTGCTLDAAGIKRVGDAIMSTKAHQITSFSTSVDKAIIRADLHALTDKVTTIQNFVKIMNESIKLYGVTPEQFAESNILFMEELRERVILNSLVDKHFYEQVLDGIDTTTRLAEALI